MKKIFIIFFIIVSSLHAQTFQDFIDQLNSLPDSLRPALVDSFMNAAESFPYLEQDTLAHFIYANTASSVKVPGDFNGWSVNTDPMINISGTNFWYCSKTFESDARLDYKYVINGSTWILDPLNPSTCMGGFGPNSELSMPQYIQPPEIEYYPEIPHGTLEDTVFYSQNLGNSRTVKVYLPPDYGFGSDEYPYIVFHDGLEYISLAYAVNTLDYCIYHEYIVPIIAVFVPPVNRTEEYAGNLQDEFTAFIIEELVPYIDSAYRTLTTPSNRAMLGPSYGGNITFHIGMTHPDVFGLLAPQSSYVQQGIIDSLESGQFLNLDFYIDAGTYELMILNPLEQTVVPLLENRGYPYQFNVYHEGHSWGNWRAHVDNALIRFFPGPGLGTETRSEVPDYFRLLKGYPNPFNNETKIYFSVPESGETSLAVYNLAGRKVCSLFGGSLSAGTHETYLNGEKLSSGMYFVRLSGQDYSAILKLLLIK